MKIYPIVEGHGETHAVPILLRRLAWEIRPQAIVEIHRPARVPRDRLLKAGELERHVERGGREVAPNGAVFVLVDADDACAATLGPTLLARARAVRGDIAVGVVLACHEFENWFIAAAESLRGVRGLPGDLTGEGAPERVRGATEWIAARKVGASSDVEVLDQPALMAKLDIQAARRARSFDKCYRVLEGFLAQGRAE